MAMSNESQKAPGRGRTILLIVVLSVALGSIGGLASAKAGLPPAVIWAIFAPVTYLFLWPLLTRRRSSAKESPSKDEVLLLDASNTGGRIVQAVLPLIGTLLGAVGVAMLFRAGGGISAVSVSLTLVGIALIVVSLRQVIGWNVSYKGHSIRFENDPCSGERLYIDGQLVDRGGVGIHMVLMGKVASDDGVGDVIKAASRAGIPFHVRIVALRQ